MMHGSEGWFLIVIYREKGLHLNVKFSGGKSEEKQERTKSESNKSHLI